ncbi:MAG: DUF4434 domain-containing protein [Armatimonadetes bacterium]|nr:DUF4434 domain-containing protein [Armatimonadota bacterium]
MASARQQAAGAATLAIFALAYFIVAAPAQAPNIALDGTARSWHENSVASVPVSLATDGDLLTFWGSNAPTTDPPKDLGVEWEELVTAGCVIARFYSADHAPAEDGWELQGRRDGDWFRLDATVENTDGAWWTFRFPPTQLRALRLLVTAYRHSRVAVSEFEVYGNAPEPEPLRRAPVLDGAFWAFHYENWAKHFPADELLAREVDSAHAIGLDIMILYTLTGADETWSTVVPDTCLPQSPWWSGRDPLEAILTRADALGMRVYLGDGPPTGFGAPGDARRENATERRLNQYREEMLARYAGHPSLVGYYINYECCPAEFGNDPAIPSSNSQRLARHIRNLRPGFEIIQPVGLYNWRASPQEPWHAARPEEIESFWRPYIAACPDVDVFMVIDGVGTGLSPLNYTHLNQARLRSICDQLGKGMWTDVEVAVMGRRYEPMPVGRLAQSLEVAARHADTLVGFCYFNYMSPNNGRETSARLYSDYRTYRLGALTAGAR